MLETIVHNVQNIVVVIKYALNDVKTSLVNLGSCASNLKTNIIINKYQTNLNKN